MAIITERQLSTIGDPAVVFTFGRSGTHFMMDLIRHQFAEFETWKYPGERLQGLYVELDGIATLSEPVERSLTRLSRSARPVLKTHDLPITRRTLGIAQPALAAWLSSRGRLIHVVRDPRAAIASWWALEHAGHTPGFGDASWTPEAFIEARAHAWVEHIAVAATEREVLRFRLEDIVHSQRETVWRLARWLGVTPRWRRPTLPKPTRSVPRARLDCALAVRPASTEILIRRQVRRACHFDWTPRRLDLLGSIAGEAMAGLGYPAVRTAASISTRRTAMLANAA